MLSGFNKNDIPLVKLIHLNMFKCVFYRKKNSGKMCDDNSFSEEVLNDIVHGIIVLPSYIRQIINTEAFQRMRYVAQVGLSYFVYPSASYSRFEHLVGTFHLASLLMNQLRRQAVTDKLCIKVTDEDIKCVEIAALCHDLGHGPLSHLWTHAFSLSKTIKSSFVMSHEELSVKIFENIMNISNLKDEIPIKDKIGLNDNMIDKIGRIILGRYDKKKDSNKRFLFEVVANKDSGLDVDKFDYLCRDSIYFGWSNNNKIHDIKRIMFFLKIVKEKDGNEWRLAVRDREIFHIFDIFYYRHLLHRYGYQHKTAMAVQCMMKKALATLIDNGKLNELIENLIGEIKQRNLTEVLYSKEFISKCCDFHIWNMMDKYTNDIVTNIRKRNLYKLYCKLQLIRKMTQNDLLTLQKLLKGNLKNSSIIVSIASSYFSLSSEKGNPIYRIPFYKKDTPNEYFMFDEKLNPPPSLLKYTYEDFNILIFTDRVIERESEEDKALCTIIDELCRVDDVDKNIVKERLNDFVKENFEENKNDKMRNTERQLKDISRQLNISENDNQRLTEIDDLRKRYNFCRLNY